MASVYILYSTKLDRYYTGSCQNLNYRLDQHVNKDYIKSFTAKVDDWELYFYQDHLTYHQARLIEAHIKKMRSSKYIQKMKKHAEIMEKLMLKYNF